MSNNYNGQQKQHYHHDIVVLMVPLPAQGHLNQLLHLSCLILSYNIPVHYVGSSTHNRQARLRAQGSDPRTIHFHDFELPPFLSPPPNPNSKNKFPSHLQPSFNATAHLQVHVTKLLHELSCMSRKVVVIHDSLTASVVQEVRKIPNAESYTFHSVSAFAIYLHLKERIGQISAPPNGVIIPEKIPSLDGCFTVEFLDFIAKQYEYHEFDHGNIYNTSELIEGAYMDLIDKLEWRSISGKKIKKKHWALGPFNPVTVTPKVDSKRTHFCLDWLDKQESNTVLYVSFGTTTAMNDDQIKELAIGLKQSNQKFIWVLRDADKGDVFDGSEKRRIELPNGYESSVDGNGLVIRDWSPQLDILANPAIGGFMSHCGWNSCMESITMGVPIAAWPMHSDQPRNSVLITEILKIGCVVSDWDCGDEVVSSRSVESAVRKIMASKEGEKIRKRAAELGKSVRRSMGDGGISSLALDSFIAHITA